MAHEVTDFQAEVIEKSRSVPVLADFWAPWCGPCRVLGPVLERLERDAAGRWVLAKVNTEEHPAVAARYGIQGIPNVKLFVDGEVADEFTGALPESEVRRWLDGAIPPPYAAAVAKARAMTELGQFAEAARLLRAVVAEQPGDAAARVALAEVLLHVDPERVEESLAGVEIPGERADRVEALRTLARLVARPAGEWPPGPARPLQVAGLEAVRAGDWDAALQGFIGALRAGRGWADGAAREAGRAVFVYLGVRHPACERHHRAFSSAVNV